MFSFRCNVIAIQYFDSLLETSEFVDRLVLFTKTYDLRYKILLCIYIFCIFLSYFLFEFILIVHSKHRSLIMLSSGRSRKVSTSAQHHREALQLRTQADWAGREYVDLMSGSIKRIADFLNAFHLSCSSRLAELNSRYALHLFKGLNLRL